MLTSAKKAKYPLSTSKPSGPSSGSSRVLEGELTKPNEAGSAVISSHAAPEIQAAQKLIAQIAVRILIERKKKRDEHRNSESDPSSDHP